MAKDRYTYRVTWSPEDGEYVGVCAEFPSLSWLEEKPEEAFRGIRRLGHRVIADMKANGEPIPEPLAERCDRPSRARDCRSRWPLRPWLRLPATDALPHAGSGRLHVAA